VKRIVTWAIALTFTLGLYAPGVARAHVAEINTRLSMFVSDATPNDGQSVVFRGALKSKNRRCFRNQQIQILRNGSVFKTTRTNNRGRYRVAKKVTQSGRYRARFNGFGPFGTHPHSHTCKPSQSSQIRIRVN
jgi:hypothetical protein